MRHSGDWKCARKFGWVLTMLGLAVFTAPVAAAQPPAPYYSIELGRETTSDAAVTQMERLARLGTPADLRVEQRRTGWYLRAGAWATRADAVAALKSVKVRNARILQIENAVPWLLVDGTTVAVAGTGSTEIAAAVPSDPAPARTAPAAAAAGEDLTALDLEQLMSMEVTGVTRRTGSLASTPAAVFVLTGDEITRAGARTALAEALRMVPGLYVARTNAQNYTVTSRGLGGDKLQVLIDGRSVYTPLTSTVFWDVVDTRLSDIARIEVIRGPGATVWGANAVNGVINIVTKAAADTLGTELNGAAGKEERALGGYRGGARISDWGEGRIYLKGRERDSTVNESGAEVVDGQSQLQAGGRVDARLGDLGRLTATGDIYDSRMTGTAFPSGRTENRASGRNLGLQWTLDHAGGAQTQAGAYYDGYDRVNPTVFAESRDTYDLSAQHTLAAFGRHVVTVGGGARLSHDRTGGPPLLVVFEPANRTVKTYNMYLQDEIAFGDWSLIAGSKFEHNDFTGFEFQPGLRFGWAAAAGTFTWAAVSQAVRTPNRIDHDIGIVCAGAGSPVPDCSTNGQVISIGSKDFDSENLLAYEWGLRQAFSPTLVADLAAFYNDYTELRSTEPGLRFDNGLGAKGFGGEFSLSWDFLDWAGARTSYTYTRVTADRASSSGDTAGENTLENGTPRQQAGFNLFLRPWPALEGNAFLRYVDRIRSQDVPAYTELNLRLGWHVTPLLELAVAGQNLLDASHPEAGANAATRSEIERSVFGELIWRWQ